MTNKLQLVYCIVQKSYFLFAVSYCFGTKTPIIILDADLSRFLLTYEMSNESFCGWSTEKLIRKYRRIKLLIQVNQPRYTPYTAVSTNKANTFCRREL